MFALLVALSSALLFLAEPIVARLLLPRFGGAAAVWTTSLVFFQTALLAGYAYAHVIARRLSPRAQAAVHTTLLLAAATVLPFATGEAAGPPGAAPPALRLLGQLTATVGAPFAVLAATSPLAQAWYTRVRGKDPYPLYAWSNVASLATLLAYPALVEPTLTTRGQVRLWAAGYLGFAALCGAIAWRAGRAPPAPHEEPAPGAPRDPGITLGRALPWLALAAVPSMLLSAITNHLSQNVAAAPLLWILPLLAYLLTFVLAFQGQGWYPRFGIRALAFPSVAAMGYLLVAENVRHLLLLQVGAFVAGLFLLCMFAHGELARRKPGPEGLTAYWLLIAAGGTLGSILVGVGAPLVLTGHYETAISLVAWGAVAVVVSLRRGPRFVWAPAVAALAAVLVLGSLVRADREGTRVSVRNFYGVLRVKAEGQGEDAARQLVSGSILHGEQLVADDRRRDPTTYYTQDSGVGLALQAIRGAQPLRIGVVGLGAGTLAAYGQPGDVIRFYEISPAVVDIARREFTFLKDCPARVEVAVGDARMSLEHEPSQRFDLLVIDAFSGDAIPVHLLTAEALATYLRHMRPAGVIAFHVSNRYLDLAPVVEGIAAQRGLGAVHTVGEDADWVLVSADRAILADKEIRDAAEPPAVHLRPWTDDFHSLVPLLR